MTHKIKKVVFPVAGLGTRFLPITKSIPKEMLPLGNHPLIEWVVAEAMAAGCEEFIFITAPHKPSIASYFSPNKAVEAQLKKQGKTDTLKQMQTMAQDAPFTEIIQQEALGLGHAIYQARDVIGAAPFAVILPDDIIKATTTPCLQQMANAYRGGNMLAIERVAQADVHRYGIIKPQADIDSPYIDIESMIEKPTPQEAPSDLAIVGRYILEADIMDVLAHAPQGAGGEIQLTDAIAAMTPTTALSGWQFEGKRYDCGTPTGWLDANIAYKDVALQKLHK
ncbi:MAG: UTP--glucose-1-phosphate uridylyltransferase [Alphaproteobacteria bacterium]|nr:UTP--glucose-1-phosphate uridylyltransferase [Alphaproteobacteria bacterium]